MALVWMRTVAPTGIGAKMADSWVVWIVPMAKGLVWSNWTDSTKCETSIGGTIAPPNGDSPSICQRFMSQPSYQGL